MSKELLKALVDVLDDLKLRKNLSEDDALNISDSVLVRAEKAIENYLTQPELSTDSLQLDEQDLREDLRECLRDRFAGLAMQRLLVGYSAPAYKDAAKLSYQMADAMLIAREAGL